MSCRALIPYPTQIRVRLASLVSRENAGLIVAGTRENVAVWESRNGPDRDGWVEDRLDLDGNGESRLVSRSAMTTRQDEKG